MANTKGCRAVAYARFSSDMQREESIDAQQRAIEKYAKANGYVLSVSYIDRAKSATTDKRPEFQRMIHDAESGLFDVIIVHKLDRFSRDRYDSAMYKHRLKGCGVKLLSVTENLDGSPESMIMESLIEAMAEYYSANLAREVEKGRKENALKGQHVGGIPPLGYDLDRTTMRLVLNEHEAEAVHIIFDMYIDGCGYTKILDRLNSRGYRTKKGNPFGKGSLFEILHNEKYTGVYVYNKSSAKSYKGTYNRHSYKDESEIIRVEGVMPAIVTREQFEAVQKMMLETRHKAARNTAKQDYLLTGKLICTECTSSYVGNSRKARPGHPLYVSYRCSRRNGSVKCKNSEIRQSVIEQHVLSFLAERMFDEKVLSSLYERYVAFVNDKESKTKKRIKAVSRQIAELSLDIENIVSVMMKTASPALSDKLASLEKEHAQLSMELLKLKSEDTDCEVSEEQMREAFRAAKQQLSEGSLQSKREIINTYLDRAMVFRDRVEFIYTPIPDISMKNEMKRQA